MSFITVTAFTVCNYAIGETESRPRAQGLPGSPQC